MIDSTFLRPLRAAALAGLATAALAAQAAPGSNPGRGVGNAPLGACGLTDLSVTAEACAGYGRGNDSAAELQAMVGGTAWQGLQLSTLTQYKDDNVAAGASSTALFDATQLPGDASAGALTFLQGLSAPFIVTLKGGNEVAAYYVGHGVAAGTVLGFDIPGVQGAGLSHASVYVASSAITAAVPEPQTYALMLAGLVAVGFVARRRT